MTSRQAASSGDLAALALTNYGHFTTMRVDGGRVRGLTLHLERLGRDCRSLFDTDLDLDLVRRLVRDRAAAAAEPLLVRVTVFAPGLDLARPTGRHALEIVTTIRPAPVATPPALRVTPAEYIRTLPEVKHVGLFDAIRQRRWAQRAGFDDALFTAAGRIVEGPTWNIGFCDAAGLVWPRGPALAGVTAALLSRELRAGRNPASGPVASAAVDLDDLPRMVAAFATNAAYGPRPIAAIGAHRFDPEHPALRRLQAAYAAIVAERL